MKTIDFIEPAGADGILRLQIPFDSVGTYRIVVNIEPLDTEETIKLGWPPGFFEETAGKWIGELERPPQDEYEKREPF
jgi:hypothetical protein